MHVVLTADRRGAVPAALHSTITRRTVLQLASADDYGALGVDAGAAARERPPGRAFVDGRLEAQIALVGDQPDVGAQVDAMAALGAALRDRHPRTGVPGVHAACDGSVVGEAQDIAGEFARAGVRIRRGQPLHQSPRTIRPRR